MWQIPNESEHPFRLKMNANSDQECTLILSCRRASERCDRVTGEQAPSREGVCACQERGWPCIRFKRF